MRTLYALSYVRSLYDAATSENNGEPLSTRHVVGAVRAPLPIGARIPVRFCHPNNPSRDYVVALKTARQWFPMQRCVRNTDGQFDCVPSQPPQPPQPIEPVETDFVRPTDRVARKVASSLVSVRVDIPYRINGVYGASFRGAGVVVDASRGLVAVDRDTAPVMLGEVLLTFAGSIQIPARIVWQHPEHNLALVQYAPEMLGNTPVQSAKINTKPLKEGDRIWQVGLSINEQVVVRKTVAERIRAVSTPVPQVPFFRDTNISLIDPQDVVSSVGGVLTDRRGRIRANWVSFVNLSDYDQPSSYLQGLPAHVLEEAMAGFSAGEGKLSSSGVVFGEISLAEARQRGLGQAQAEVLEAHDDRRQLLEVIRLRAGAPATALIRPGDLVLSVNGQPATRFEEVERASREDSIRFELFRNDQIIDATISTVDLSTQGPGRVISWSGALLQQTPAEAAVQRGVPASGVYVSWFWYGSPAAQYGLRATRRIIRVDGVEIDSLDAFLDAVKDKPDRAAIRITTRRLDGREEVLTLRQDLHYWPTFQLVRTESGWERGAL